MVCKEGLRYYHGCDTVCTNFINIQDISILRDLQPSIASSVNIPPDQNVLAVGEVCVMYLLHLPDKDPLGLKRLVC